MCCVLEDQSHRGVWLDPYYGLSAVEHKIVDREKKLNLYSVRFENFERAVMRFGFVGRLSDHTLAEIAPDINLNLDEVFESYTIHHFYLQNNEIFKEGFYDPKKLMLLGYLLTSHSSLVLA